MGCSIARMVMKTLEARANDAEWDQKTPDRAANFWNDSADIGNDQPDSQNGAPDFERMSSEQRRAYDRQRLTHKFG